MGRAVAKCRALIAALGTADTVILVDVGDLTAHAAGDLPKLPFLSGRGLVDCRNPKIENRALHDFPHSMQ